MKREILSIIGAIILILVTTLLVSRGVIGMSEVSPWIAGILVKSIVGILLWGFKPRIERVVGKTSSEKTLLDPRFIHLEIHYPQRRDTPNTHTPSIPRFVVNKTTKQAYWIPDFLEPYIKKRVIQWNTHDGEKALRAYFRKQKIQLNEMNPSPETLELGLCNDGSLIRLDQNIVALLPKLREHKNKDLRVARLFPWYRPFSFLQKGHPRKRLIIRYSTKKAFESLLYDKYLIDNNMIDFQNFTLRPREHLRDWATRRSYKYQPKRFSEDDLTKEA